MQKSATSQAILCGMLAAIIWGIWPIVSHLGISQALTVFDVTALRVGVAGMILLPLVWRRGVIGVGWLGAAVMAFGAGAPYVLVAVGGLTFAPAGHAGIIIPSSMLSFSTLGGWWILRERPNRTRMAGILIILIGVLMIGWKSFSTIQGQQWVGDLMFVLAGLLWAVYTIASRHWEVEALHATALVSVISLVVFLPVYLLFTGPRVFSAHPAELILQAVFQGVFTAILALLFYTRSVAVLGAARGAVFAALVPGIALLVSFIFLGEVPNGLEIVGVTLVTLGMFLALELQKMLSKNPAVLA